MTGRAATTMKCHNCNAGQVQPLAAAGRTARYKNIEVTVPADLAVLTCDHCGEEWITPEDAKRIDTALEQVYRAELLRRARAVLPDPKDAPRVERDLGLSPGYLSRIRKGVRVPSSDLVTLLALIRERPGLLKNIEAFWASRPEVQP